MENTATSSNQKNKKKGFAPRRAWSQREEETLMNALKEIISNGWKSENGFRPGYLRELEFAMIKEFPTTDIRVDPHIESRIRAWKRMYASLSELLKNGQGWNPETKMLDVSDEAWNAQVKNDKSLRSLRFRPLPFLSDCQDIFGKDLATGDGADDFYSIDIDQNVIEVSEDETEGIEIGLDATPPASGHATSSIPDVQTSSVTKSQQPSGNSSKSKGKKRKGRDDSEFFEFMTTYGVGLNAQMEKIAERIGYEQDVSKARKEVYEKTDEFKDMTMVDKVTAAAKLATNRELLELFFSMTYMRAKKELLNQILNGSL